MAHHRQQAARMTRDELAQLADELIQRAHRQEHLIIELQRAAANLMIQLSLHDAPASGEPSAEHHQWAREVLAESRGPGWLQRLASRVRGR